MSAPLAHQWWDAAYAADLSGLDRRYRVRARAVLVALARHADPAGRCWPSAARLAAMTELGERTVGYALADLVTLRLIERERRHRPTGFRSTDEYRLRLDLGAATAPRRPRLTAATAPSQGAATAEQNGSGVNGTGVNRPEVKTMAPAGADAQQQGEPGSSIEDRGLEVLEDFDSVAVRS